MVTVEEQLTYEERMLALSADGAALGLTEPRPLKLTVADLALLDRHWQDDDHKSTELIDGRIYFTPARYMPRVQITQDIWLQLREAAAVVAPHLSVGMRGSIECSLYDLPLPDIVLSSDPHGEGFIPAASVPLVVEIADTRLEFYATEKMHLYARAGIPEYWTVDVQDRRIHRWSHPMSIGYSDHDEVMFGQPIASTAIYGVEIKTSML